MELYNFFTEVISENEKDRLAELKDAKNEIVNTFKGKGHCELVLFTGRTGEKSYSIVGQIYGDDTSVGDTDLVGIFIGIHYTWFDAFQPKINNVSI